jgi:lauroyl/myristoyl acyltransferase
MQLRKRHLAKGKPPLFLRRDAAVVLELIFVTLIATFTRERSWSGFALRFEGLKSTLGFLRVDEIVRGLRIAFGASSTVSDAKNVSATRTEHHIQVAREWLWGWKDDARLEGEENIVTALSSGSGAVLWVAHFSFNALASKKALHRRGFSVSHISRPEHGFSKSRFGIACLNPIRVIAERRYLRERIIIDRDAPFRTIQHARRRLESGGLVSITAGAWEGAQIAAADICGGRLDLSVGAPGLSFLTGAPLLPVYTVRETGSLEIRVVIGKPIPVPRNLSRAEAVYGAAKEFAARLEPYVCTYPFQWRDWDRLEA